MRNMVQSIDGTSEPCIKVCEMEFMNRAELAELTAAAVRLSNSAQLQLIQL